ncbi:MAG: hypothetical protein KAR39_02690 [Thermoplasmata archaeon]|nr:hypothetical protein [Thermoplasmata archaeon]
MVLASSIALIVSMVLAGAVSDVDQEERTISSFNSQSPLTVDVDCDPDTLNLKSNGKWITCYIEVEEFVGSVFVIEQANLSEVVVPIPTSGDATAFYGYSSASSHTGFEAPHKSVFFLHKDTSTDETSLIIHHNIDLDESGIATGYGRVDFDLEGVPPSGFVAQSDDPNNQWDPPRGQEFSLAYPGLEGHWAYGENTDGGVLSGLPNDENWSITINPLYWLNIDSWEFVSGDGAAYEVDMSLSVTISHFFVSRTVHDIDISTVLLNRIVPPEQDTKYKFVTDPDEFKVDHDNDGVPELMLKFDRSDVHDILSPGEEVDFRITGRFFDPVGPVFAGTDVNRVIPGG